MKPDTSRDVRVSSWSELQDALFEGSWNERIRRFRAPFAYRGLSDADYRLETTLTRLGGPFPDLERHLLRNFRKYARGAPNQFSSFWHLISIAQHHGLPTRLLDWTYSPFVAAHFATANHEQFDKDGVIWVVDYHRTHALLPDDLKTALYEEGAQAFTVELLRNVSREFKGDDVQDESSFHDVIRTLDQFDLLGQAKEFLLFFEPPSLDDRIVNQFALFSVMPNPRRVIDDWLTEAGGDDVSDRLVSRIIIPAGLKWEIRDKLDQSNITERVLFPGLDGLSSWLRRHYHPKT